jgi:Protein similar to CwfJ C-terminus 1
MYTTSAAGRLQRSCSNTWHGKQLRCFTVPCVSSVCGSFVIVQEKEGKKARAAAIADARRMGSALDACTLCITSARRPRHLTLAIGQASYLMLPAR